MRLILAALILAAFVLVWKFTPLAEYATPERITPFLENLRETPWAVPAALGLYTLGTLIFFPHMVMTAAIVLAFEPWQSVTIAMGGSLLSGAIGYGAGRLAGMRSLKAITGKVSEKIEHYTKRGGVLGLTLLRLVPIAPFTAVNLVLGMSGTPFLTFLAATFLGLLPGTLVSAYLGASLMDLWENPDAESIAMVVGGLMAWIGIVAGSHVLAKRFRPQAQRAA